MRGKFIFLKLWLPWNGNNYKIQGHGSLTVVAQWLASQDKCLKNKKDIRLICIGLNFKKRCKSIKF